MDYKLTSSRINWKKENWNNFGNEVHLYLNLIMDKLKWTLGYLDTYIYDHLGHIIQAVIHCILGFLPWFSP